MKKSTNTVDTKTTKKTTKKPKEEDTVLKTAEIDAVAEAPVEEVKTNKSKKSEGTESMKKTEKPIVDEIVQEKDTAITETIQETAKSPVKTAATVESKPSVVKTESYVQYGGVELVMDDLTKEIIELFKKDCPEDEVHTVKVYVKPEDRAVYYVINDSYSGKMKF